MIIKLVNLTYFGTGRSGGGAGFHTANFGTGRSGGGAGFHTASFGTGKSGGGAGFHTANFGTGRSGGGAGFQTPNVGTGKSGGGAGFHIDSVVLVSPKSVIDINTAIITDAIRILTRKLRIPNLLDILFSFPVY